MKILLYSLQITDTWNVFINSFKHSSELILCCRLQGHGSEDLALMGSTFHLRDVRGADGLWDVY